MKLWVWLQWEGYSAETAYKSVGDVIAVVDLRCACSRPEIRFYKTKVTWLGRQTICILWEYIQLFRMRSYDVFPLKIEYADIKTV